MELIERAKDLIQNQQRERLPRTLGNHLRDRESQHEVRQILLAARDHGLRAPVLEYEDVVLIVELELVVTSIRELRQERARELRQFRAKLKIQIGAQVGIGAIALVVQQLVHRELREQPLALAKLPR